MVRPSQAVRKAHSARATNAPPAHYLASRALGRPATSVQAVKMDEAFLAELVFLSTLGLAFAMDLRSTTSLL